MMGDYLSDSEWHFSKVVEEKHVFVEAPRLIKPKKNISNNNNNSYNNPRSRSKYNNHNNNNQNYPNERNYDQDHHTFNLRQDSTDDDDDSGVNVGQNYYISSASSSSSSGSGNSGVTGVTGARRVKNNRSRYNNINNSNNNRAYHRRVPNFNYYDDDVPPSPYIPNPNADFSPPCPMVPVQEIIPCMSETFEDKFRLSAQAFDDLTKLALGFWRECKDVPIEWANTDTFFKSVPVEFRHYRYEYDHTNEEDDSWKPPTWGDWSSIEQANKSKPANVKKKSIKRQI